MPARDDYWDLWDHHKSYGNKEWKQTKIKTRSTFKQINIIYFVVVFIALCVIGGIIYAIIKRRRRQAYSYTPIGGSAPNPYPTQQFVSPTQSAPSTSINDDPPPYQYSQQQLPYNPIYQSY